MFKSLNKGISTPIAIIIIVVCALLVGGIVVWQYWWPSEIPSEIPSEKINNIEKERLIEIAENYILTEPKVYFENSQWVEWNDEKTLGVKLDANWIVGHEPKSVEYNPPDKWPSYAYLNDKYVVRWFFIPGCEERPEDNNWFNEQGIQCVGGYVLNVLIKPNLEPDQILLVAVR